MKKTKFIPKDLDIDKLITEHPPGIRNFKKEHLIKIVSLINEIPAYNKRIYNDLLTYGFIPLNAQQLRKSGIYNYNEYLIYLIRVKVLETDNQYIKGEKSRGYRFTLKYRQELRPVEIEVKKGRTAIIKEKKTQREYKHLWRWFTDPQLTIDAESAYAYNAKRLREETEKETNQNKRILPPEVLIRHNAKHINIYKIKNRDYNFTVDTTGNRLHTNLTSLSSDLRRYVRYDNKSLVGIDLNNSQPYFSTTLLDANFYKKKSGQISIYDYFNPNSTQNTQNIQKTTSHTLMLLKSLQPAEKENINVYVELVSNGILYDYLQVEFNKPGGEQYTRDHVKKTVFAVFYSSNSLNIPEKNLMQNLFPPVIKIFNSLKRENYKVLPILLQRIEAKMFLNIICKAITTKYPDLPIWTMHDSIVTLKGSENLIYPIIYNTLTEQIGITPTLEIKPWEYCTSTEKTEPKFNETATITFGQYRGQRYRDLPLDYLLEIAKYDFTRKLGKRVRRAINSAIWYKQRIKSII